MASHRAFRGRYADLIRGARRRRADPRVRSRQELRRPLLARPGAVFFPEAPGGSRLILIGHSMGGAVIAEGARLMPGRVIGLIGVDTLENIEYPLIREELEKMTAPLKEDFRTGSRQFVGEMLVPGSDPTAARMDPLGHLGCAPGRGFERHERNDGAVHHGRGGTGVRRDPHSRGHSKRGPVTHRLRGEPAAHLFLRCHRDREGRSFPDDEPCRRVQPRNGTCDSHAHGKKPARENGE